MGKINDLLNSKIIKKDVGEETYLTWRETLSYAVGRGAQGMNTSMTSSKYINFFLTNVLFKKLKDPMSVAAQIRLYCGIFDAINDPIMGVIVDKTRTKDGQMRPYIKWAPLFVSLVMILFFIGSADASPLFNIIYTTILFVGLDVTYTAFDIPMGALAFSITPSGIERTKLFGVSSIVRSVLGALPQVFVAGAALLPYFKDHTPQAYLTSAIISAIGIVFLTRLTYKNTKERAEHKEEFPGFLFAGILVPKIIESLGKKADSKRFYQGCCVAAIILHVLFAVTCYNGLMNKTEGTSVSLFVGILVVLFTGLTAIPLEFKNLIQKEMEAETVDYIEWKTGTRVEGIMLSIMSFTGKIENTFSSSIGLAILGFTGYMQHTEGSMVQNPQTNMALFLLTTLVPAIGYLLMLVPMHFYHITGDGHRQMMKEIMERRAQLKSEKGAEAEVSESVAAND